MAAGTAVHDGIQPACRIKILTCINKPIKQKKREAVRFPFFI